MDSLILYLVLIAVGVGIFIVFRAVILWYFKLDEIAKDLSTVAENSATIAKNTSAIAERLYTIQQLLRKSAATSQD